MREPESSSSSTALTLALSSGRSESFSSSANVVPEATLAGLFESLEEDKVVVLSSEAPVMYAGGHSGADGSPASCTNFLCFAGEGDAEGEEAAAI
jgi:hypothetical protein